MYQMGLMSNEAKKGKQFPVLVLGVFLNCVTKRGADQ